jgi:anti-anti-sigma regulatory factor
MASNFHITFSRLADSIYLNLKGDFDGSSAHELLNLLKDKSHDTAKIYIQTDGLKYIHPFGLNTFFKNFRILNGCADRIVFTGKKAPALALPSDHWSL